MTVKKRIVFYFSGFDPRGARHYYQLYRTEAEKQARLAGYDIEIGKRERIDDHLLRWPVAWQDGETRVETDYVFGEWDDIVRRFWVRNPLHLAWVTLTASWRALRVGVFGKTLQWSWPAFVTATLPVIVKVGS